MVEAVVITLPGVLFIVVVGSAVRALQRQHIDASGEPPIDRRLFYASKCGMFAVWAAMITASWGVPLAFVEVPGAVRAAAVFLWVAGIAVASVGRFDLGNSFRMGSPKEQTSLRTAGLYRFSRNPMYLGLYLSLAATVLYTLNPLVLLVALFVVAVHHRIVLAEEQFLAAAFPSDYEAYCGCVRRYL
jgi:protein-S-isoprenylcysteine O-methyltransferase Ste14